MTAPGAVTSCLMGTSQDARGRQRALTAVGYLVLFLLGFVLTGGVALRSGQRVAVELGSS